MFINKFNEDDYLIEHCLTVELILIGLLKKEIKSFLRHPLGGLGGLCNNTFFFVLVPRVIYLQHILKKFPTASSKVCTLAGKSLIKFI